MPARPNIVLLCSVGSLCLVGLLANPRATAQSAASQTPTAAEIDFSHDILPLLSDRCFKCHGPDAEQRATDLRLDERESTLELAVVPGEPDESELIHRIFSEDPDLQMPPPDSNLELSPSEKNLLREWIQAGAHFSQHWSFVAPEAAEIPIDADDRWSRNPIDRFVRRQWAARQLAPAPAADRTTLIRRVTLDLTGLPPTPQAVDEFLADDSPGAYERVVDRLLESEQYGEHMAIAWLDAARYADTHGYQNDRYRATWPWRDWVVSAFNCNLPYDQFITWQLAGDLLPQATREQILATAFNRLHRQTNEGGSVEEEFRIEYVADRVNTFGAAFLGLTLECCRCHDHKYDPLTQRTYYELSAFFNSIDESGLYSHFTDDTPTPSLSLTTPEQTQQLHDLEARIQHLEAELASVTPSDETFHQWRSQLRDVRGAASGADASSLRDLLEQSLTQGLIGDYPLDDMQDSKLLNRVTGERTGNTSEAPANVPGKVNQALKFSGEDNATLPQGGDFTRDQPFSIAVWVKTSTEFERAVLWHRSRAWTDAASRGYELLIEEGRLSAALIHFWPGNAIRVVSRGKLPLNRWTHVTVTYDGSSRARGLQLFIDGNLATVDVVRDKLTRQIHGPEANELSLGQRFRDVGFKDGQLDELKIYDRRLLPLEVKILAMRDALPANIAEVLHNVRDDLLQEYLAEHNPPLNAQRSNLRSQLRAVRAERSELIDPIPEIMVMREEPEPRPTYLLTRGAYDAPADEVYRATPQSILPTDLPPDATRLDLARWLTDPRHPLTARVAVNRFWQSLFGRGIVATSEDFGLQGELPSHPELLDWLAVHFVDSGWDVKGLLKLIVMSSTYRQSSDPSPALLELDPENRWLARGPAVRLSAEMIRDSALAASGLLVQQLGGPPVKPYQPEGLWEEKSGVAYTRDGGQGSRRRSLYTYWKRTSPPPSMMTFDASNREVCVVNRQTTMTPLQVLVLLNDPQFVEAAVALAEAALQQQTEPDKQLSFIYRRLCGRWPNEAEAAVLRRMLTAQRAHFEGQAEAAQQLVHSGDHRPAQDLPYAELAALASIAGGLMSFDEFLMKR